jgi:predicted acylesterase/phospholipase RssA
MSDEVDFCDLARKFLAGQQLSFDKADALWQHLTKLDEISLARAVLHRIRDSKSALLDELPASGEVRDRLCQQEALLTSKDPELGVSMRHNTALGILNERFDLGSSRLDGDGETLGIAGGILKRQWEDLGQFDDLRRASEYYRRGALGDVGDDAYAHINAAFLEDILAARGDETAARRTRAAELRNRIVAHVPPETTAWWPAVSRAEALLGLGRYAEALQAVQQATRPAEPWKLQTTTRQLAAVAHLREPDPMNVPEIEALFKALVPGAEAAIPSWFIGKVGLALSGGGFRASFYHLGVLARLAELDVLRHVEVLSCVSGGSIVGACYWLSLGRKLQELPSMTRQDYVDLVGELIDHFEAAVASDLRHGVQPSRRALLGRILLKGEHGALDPERTADELEKRFYQPLYGGAGRSAADSLIYMDELPFDPKDHDPTLTGSLIFQPGKHNWLRANKVPALVINATTVNTGRGWQFTTTWMGESPWALNEGADNIERLEWANYNKKEGWRMRLARAVAASACVPFIFEPLKFGKWYENVNIELVDGGVFDNQGVVALLAANCTVLLVSDASGQLRLEPEFNAGVKEFGRYAQRSMDILMERARIAVHADLCARHLSGLIRGLMFLHMKAGLDAETMRLPFSMETYQLERTKLSPSGVRKDFQRVLSELRTDLDAFSQDESRCLMACGYQMAAHSFAKNLAQKIPELAEPEAAAAASNWRFAEELGIITSSHRDDAMLASLQQGTKVDYD